MRHRHSLAERIQSGVADFLAQFREYLGIGGLVRHEPIQTPEALRAFLSSRASFIAQTSLYGYLRTRAGTRYPELFDDAPFVAAINIAKWHVWLACLSDLTAHAGGLLARGGLSSHDVGVLMPRLLDDILAETGVPAEADAEFPDHAARVRARIAMTPWSQVDDGEGCFHESPAALVKWAPVIENLKQLDAAIVRNSVRFHWQEVRRELRQHLDVAAIGRSVP